MILWIGCDRFDCWDMIDLSRRYFYLCDISMILWIGCDRFDYWDMIDFYPGDISICAIFLWLYEWDVMIDVWYDRFMRW